MLKPLDLLIGKQIIAISPYYDGKYFAIIYSHQDIYYVVETVEKLMDQFCQVFGSTLEGRKNAARNSLGQRKNPSILISDHYQIAAFSLPTKEKLGEQYIFDLEFQLNDCPGSGCELVFSDQVKLSVPLSKEAVMKRKLRTLDLLYSFTKVQNT
nr:competence protein ComK [Lysinibacillus timonensis]